LSQYVDSLIVIPNEKLKQVTDTRITLANAFEIADNVLHRGVKSVSDLVNESLFINLDFADVTSVMKNAGYAHMGIGSATGKDKAEQAARAAISSPLLESSIKGARGVLISIMVSPDVGLEDVDLASTMIANEAHPDASVIWGVGFDPELEDEMRITIIATGFDKKDDNPIPAVKVALQPKSEPVAKQVPTQQPAPAAAADDDLDDMLKMFKRGTRK
ncbi:MAG: cell division protein FtsZ, partial [Clostridia bacterium]|nr:cell division protein FtsZ [Clostridia bacterium]